MTSQLSRRRGGNSSQTSSPPVPSSNNFTSTGDSDGHRIAYDPRDLPASSAANGAGGEPPLLTLMEEVLLLGIKDRAGYLSFWNDNISYALRGTILIELAMRGRISVKRERGYTAGSAYRNGTNLGDRIVTVISTAPTGETILDETLKLMKGQETEAPSGSAAAGGGGGSWGGGSGFSGGAQGNGVASAGSSEGPLSIQTWLDLLSGETWNVLKIGYQLKQVRERLAKGLVDKGILRTEKRNFLLFDMATHPVADPRAKAALLRRIQVLLTSTTHVVPDGALHPTGTQHRTLRTVALVCAAYAGSVLENVWTASDAVNGGYEEQEAAFVRAEDILAEFSVWPWGATGGGPGGGVEAMKSRRKAASRIASGGGGTDPSRESILGLLSAVRAESEWEDGVDEDPRFEVVAGVFEVLGRLDSLL